MDTSLIKKIFFLLCIMHVVFQFSKTHAQNPVIDSLQTILKTAKEDTNKAIILNALSYNLALISDYQKSLEYAQSAQLLSQKIKFKKGEARACKIMGSDYLNQGDFQKAEESFLTSLKINNETGAKKGIADCNNNLGITHYYQSNYPEALKNYFDALKIYESLGDKKGIADTYGNMGIVYMEQGNLEQALKNYFASLQLQEKIGDKRGAGNAYNNIGIIYHQQGNYSEALKNYSKALELRQELEDKAGIAGSYNNIGSMYSKLNNYPQAFKFFLSALKIATEIGFKEQIVSSNINLAGVNIKLKKYADAKQQLDNALSLSKEIMSNDAIKESYNGLANLDSATGNWKAAYDHNKLYILYRDSLINDENTKKTVQTQMQYEFDKKESLTQANQDKKDAIALQEKQKQKLITYAVSAGLMLVMLLSIFIFRSYRQKQKANIIITKQKEVVEEKNRQITDSITYALRIQTAILPPTRLVKQYLDNSFILYLPKDIVAGDFYWMESVECVDVPMNQFADQIILFAACDCTGHGVSGAMVSVVCHNALNRAVKEFGLTQPAAILNKVGELVVENFSKSEAEVKDGMDASLCAYFPKTKVLHWAGANSPLWIVRNGGVIETKADKQPIGKFDNMHAFTHHEFQLQSNDCIYIFSDGFADQFGGAKQKKLTRKKFKELLLNMQHISFGEQGKELEKFITNYRNNTEQVDDILVLGVKV